MGEIARGENFTLVRRHGYLQLTVVRRSDLTLEQGTEAARAMFALLMRLDAEAPAGVALLMMLDDAPLPGPDTRAAITEFYERWIDSGRRVGVVTRHAAMKMLYGRLLSRWDDRQACCFDDLARAELWAAAVPGSTSDGLDRAQTGLRARPSSGGSRERVASDPQLRGLSGQVLLAGDNFTLHLFGRVGVLVVVRRPDLSLERGAANAREMFAQAHLLLGRDDIDALVVDLSEAPVPGPNTRATLGELIACWEQAGRRIAMVVGHPTMRMLFRRLISAHAPTHGGVFEALRAARLWAAGVSRETITTTSGGFETVPRRGTVSSFESDEG